ncbi:hypothetical protein C8R47DRAFT_1109057 [Mycena vitilis]|nr:hypothetical protein C8R47DRAFT_1109057 [Mycena vitilis]
MPVPTSGTLLSGRIALEPSFYVPEMEPHTSVPADISPVLPEDVQRLILERAALVRLGSIPTLMLVAHRVRAWVEPLLYRELVIHDEVHQVPDYEPSTVRSDERYYDCPTFSQSRMKALIALKTIGFFRSASRTVRLFGILMDYNIVPLFSAMSGITDLDLGFHCKPEYLPAMAQMTQLRRLKTALKPLFGWDTETTPFAHPVFRHLTHLFACDNWANIEFAPSQWEALGEVAALTHLGLYRMPTGKHMVDILAVCRLECLVICHKGPPAAVPDTRVVQLRQQHVSECIRRYHFRYDEWCLAEMLLDKNTVSIGQLLKR